MLMSPQLRSSQLSASRSYAAVPKNQVASSSDDFYIALSEPLPVGFSHFAFFIGGNGAQSNVEIGIAQHDDAFKWLLKKSADGCIAVNTEENLNSWDMGWCGQLLSWAAFNSRA